MKNVRKKVRCFIAGGLVLLVSVYASCKKLENVPLELDVAKLSVICSTKKVAPKGVEATVLSGVQKALPYTVELLARKSNGEGAYTWIWAISNPNPGNGNNGTTQDLSNWGISLGTCAKIEDIVNAATSADGRNWQSFTPEYKEDKSQKCYSGPIVKFNAGTNGAAKTYYRLVVNKNFSVEKRNAVFKSGNRTGCAAFKICAIGCL